jgi:hypothetical protein
MVRFCKPFFWEQPTILFQTSLLWGKGACVSELVNQIMLIFTLAFLIGFPMAVASGKHSAIFLPLFVATLVVLPTVFRLSAGTVEEGFQIIAAPESTGPAAKADLTTLFTNQETAPTARNPFMNVLVDEYYYNPKRPAAADITSDGIKLQLDDFFRTEFTRDPTDVFSRSQSQRQFVSMPASTIPNDGGSFQNWLYKLPGKTCKEGGREACFPGTDGATIPWLSSAV